MSSSSEEDILYYSSDDEHHDYTNRVLSMNLWFSDGRHEVCHENEAELGLEFMQWIKSKMMDARLLSLSFKFESNEILAIDFDQDRVVMDNSDIIDLKSNDAIQTMIWNGATILTFSLVTKDVLEFFG